MKDILVKVHLRLGHGVITKSMNISARSLETDFRLPLKTNKPLTVLREIQDFIPNIPTLVFVWDGKTKAGNLPLLDLKEIINY